MVRVQVEVPKGNHIKRNAQGEVAFISPIPCPFNYGSVPDTISEDGEPLDAIVLGGSLPLGHSGDYRVVGLIDFVDAGHEDPKLVCIQSRFTEEDREVLISFFTRYAKIKAPLNRMRFKGSPTLFRGFLERPQTPPSKTH